MPGKMMGGSELEGGGMKVLMIGATGKFAKLVLPELTKRAATVRALIRDASKAQEALNNGANETIVGDLNDHRSLQAAAEGVECVFHIGPAFAPDEAAMGVAMVRAAQKARVRKFVFSSVLHPALSLTNHANKLPVEEAIVQSGMSFVILQPAMFMQNLEASWKTVLKNGVLSLPCSKNAKGCYVDYREVAEVSAMALTEDLLDYGTFELCAPGMTNRIELAAMMSSATGKEIQATEPPFEEWAQTISLPEGFVRNGLKAMYQGYDKYGLSGGNSRVLRSILGREPRTLHEFISELAAR
jgi:uncharacterized protein YbjT (DUF2867 family)